MRSEVKNQFTPTAIYGVALREPHFDFFKSKKNRFQALEVVTENYLFTKGERRDLLKELSVSHYVHLHGVSANIGSFDDLNQDYLVRLKELIHETDADLVSDHLCFTRMGEKSSFELLPLPRTKAMCRHIGDRVNRIRDFLGHDFLLENISSYFSYPIDEMSEIDFMTELHSSYGINFLFDVNNFYVNSKNFGFSAEKEIMSCDPASIAAYHIGGHEDMGSFLFDTHGAAVADAVSGLYAHMVQKTGLLPTFLERDENIPLMLSELENELEQILHKAQRYQHAR